MKNKKPLLAGLDRSGKVLTGSPRLLDTRY